MTEQKKVYRHKAILYKNIPYKSFKPEELKNEYKQRLNCLEILIYPFVYDVTADITQLELIFTSDYKFNKSEIEARLNLDVEKLDISEGFFESLTADKILDIPKTFARNFGFTFGLTTGIGIGLLILYIYYRVKK